MAVIYQPLRIALPDGTPSDRWRVVCYSDEEARAHRLYSPQCTCLDGHESPAAARTCPEAAAVLARQFPPHPTSEDLGRRAFEAYNASVGGLTWDGKPIPGWDAITPKIREAWCVAAEAARGAP